MRRRAILEGLQQEAEAVLRLLRRKANHIEHARLHIAAVDADGTGTHLDAVEHQVVGLGAHLVGRGFQQFLVLLHPAGKGMVHGHVALFFLAVLKKRKFRDPEQVVAVVVDEIALFGDFQAQRAQRLQRHGLFVRHEEEDVARFGPHALAQRIQQALIQEFVKGRFVAAVRREGNPGQSLGAVGLHEFSQRVNLLARHIRATLGVDAAHAAAGSRRVREHGESAAPGDIRGVHQLHVEARVRLIGAIIFHGVFPGHARQGQGQMDALHGFEHLGERALDHGLHVLRLHEAHLHVYLREFRLAVGAVVLIAEAARHLIVLIKASEH